jgi:signal transduction histidine kinase
VRNAYEEREALLERAMDASRDERRRIAADLHDGVVQDLAGVSYSLSALAEQEPDRLPPDARSTIAQAASATRATMRRLRSLLLDIHPPSLRAAGLEAALADLVGPLAARGIEVELEVEDTGPLPEEVEQLLYRAAGEAIRNVSKHAEASRVSVRLRRLGSLLQLEVVDDGIGFAAEDRERRHAEGHVGLAIVEELAARLRGTLDVTAEPGRGTRFRLEVPL